MKDFLAFPNSDEYLSRFRIYIIPKNFHNPNWDFIF